MERSDAKETDPKKSEEPQKTCTQKIDSPASLVKDAGGKVEPGKSNANSTVTSEIHAEECHVSLPGVHVTSEEIKTSTGPGPPTCTFNQDDKEAEKEEVQEGVTEEEKAEVQEGETEEEKEEVQEGETEEEKEEVQEGETEEEKEEVQEGETEKETEEVQEGETEVEKEEVQEGETEAEKEEVQEGETREEKEEVQEGETAEKKEEVQGGETEEEKEEVQEVETEAKKEEVQEGETREEKEEVQEGETREEKEEVPEGETEEEKEEVQGGETEEEKEELQEGETETEKKEVQEGETEEDKEEVQGGETETEEKVVQGGETETEKKKVQGGDTETEKEQIQEGETEEEKEEVQGGESETKKEDYQERETEAEKQKVQEGEAEAEKEEVHEEEETEEEKKEIQEGETEAEKEKSQEDTKIGVRSCSTSQEEYETVDFDKKCYDTPIPEGTDVVREIEEWQAWKEAYSVENDYPYHNKNWKFYNNEIRSMPNGERIEHILEQWFGDYEFLERNHSYIQWLFPIPASSGMNYAAQALEFHEAQNIKNNAEAKGRVLGSFKMMLDFYGFQINPDGENIMRSDNWRARFDHLNGSWHNYLRLSRILQSIGALGLPQFQAPLVRLLIDECLRHETLPRLSRAIVDHYIPAVLDVKAREELYTRYFSDETRNPEPDEGTSVDPPLHRRASEEPNKAEDENTHKNDSLENQSVDSVTDVKDLQNRPDLNTSKQGQSEEHTSSSSSSIGDEEAVTGSTAINDSADKNHTVDECVRTDAPKGERVDVEEVNAEVENGVGAGSLCDKTTRNDPKIRKVLVNDAVEESVDQASRNPIVKDVTEVGTAVANGSQDDLRVRDDRLNGDTLDTCKEEPSDGYGCMVEAPGKNDMMVEANCNENAPRNTAIDVNVLKSETNDEAFDENTEKAAATAVGNPFKVDSEVENTSKNQPSVETMGHSSTVVASEGSPMAKHHTVEGNARNVNTVKSTDESCSVENPTVENTAKDISKSSSADDASSGLSKEEVARTASAAESLFYHSIYM